MTTTIDFSGFEAKLAKPFADKGLLEQAFTHRSYINENPRDGAEHNERLEFLGDAVLELVVTDFLYGKYPSRPEGELTSCRAALVNAVTLADVATRLGMNEYLLLSKGEAKDTGRARQYILADAYEALVGALYIDQGYDAARAFIADTVLADMDRIIKEHKYRDAKSLVQEKAQEIVSFTPSYKVLEETGPDHDKHFTIGIYFGPELIAEGKGKSKQEAEQKAAYEALKKRGWME